MNKPLISIIIPCYNSFNKMTRCLEALENQTFKNFEVLIIDDCSTDGSKNNLLLYAKKSTLDIKIIENERNIGPGSARNTGIKMARGEWISFCDADDWYSIDRLQKMLEVATDADIVLCNYSKVYLRSGTIFDDYISRIPNLQKKSDIIAFALMAFWTCMIRIEIAKRIPIANLYHSEDYATMPLWLQCSNKIVFVRDSLYNYYISPHSLSRKPSINAYLDFGKAFNYMADRLIDGCYNNVVEFLGVHQVLYGGVLTAIKAKVKKKPLKNFIDEFEGKYSNWINNSYIRFLPRFKRLFLKMIKKKNFFVLRIMSFIHGFLLRIK